MIYKIKKYSIFIYLMILLFVLHNTCKNPEGYVEKDVYSFSFHQNFNTILQFNINLIKK